MRYELYYWPTIQGRGEFIRLALMGQRLGHPVFLVVEQLGELDTVLRVADEMGIRPPLGVRIKLATEGAGRWAKSGGEKSKFGLSAPQWMSGAADCTAYLDMSTGTGMQQLGSTSFHVYA